MDAFIFNLLRYILLISFVISGYKISKTKNEYWPFLIFSIILYSFMEGTRWMRGADYLYNYNISIVRTESGDIVYDMLAKVLNEIGFPFYVFFITVSALLICSIFSLVKNIREAFIPIVILLYAFTMRQSENLMRQYCAISFLFFCLSYYFRSKYIVAFSFIVLAYFTHSSVLFILPFLIVAILIFDVPFFYKSFIYKRLCYIFLILYLLSTLLSNYFSDILVGMTSLQTLLPGKYFDESYLEKAISLGESNVSLVSLSFIDRIRTSMRGLIVIILGFRIINHSIFFIGKQRVLFIVYFLACSGIIFTNSLPELEMEVIARLGIYLEIFVYVVEGYIIYVYCFGKVRFNEPFKKVIRYFVWVLVLLECIWIFRFQSENNLGLQFIWS